MCCVARGGKGDASGGTQRLAVGSILPWHLLPAIACLLEGNCPVPVAQRGSIPGARWSWESPLQNWGFSPKGRATSSKRPGHRGPLLAQLGQISRWNFWMKARNGGGKHLNYSPHPTPYFQWVLLPQGLKSPFCPGSAKEGSPSPRPVEHQITPECCLPGRSPLRYLVSRAQRDPTTPWCPQGSPSLHHPALAFPSGCSPPSV